VTPIDGDMEQDSDRYRALTETLLAVGIGYARYLPGFCYAQKDVWDEEGW